MVLRQFFRCICANFDSISKNCRLKTRQNLATPAFCERNDSCSQVGWQARKLVFSSVVRRWVCCANWFVIRFCVFESPNYVYSRRGEEITRSHYLRWGLGLPGQVTFPDFSGSHFMIVHTTHDHVVAFKTWNSYHDVFVAEEEHDSAWVVQLVHRVEIRYLAGVHQITDCKGTMRRTNSWFNTKESFEMNRIFNHVRQTELDSAHNCLTQQESTRKPLWVLTTSSRLSNRSYWSHSHK